MYSSVKKCRKQGHIMTQADFLRCSHLWCPSPWYSWNIAQCGVKPHSHTHSLRGVDKKSTNIGCRGKIYTYVYKITNGIKMLLGWNILSQVMDLLIARFSLTIRKIDLSACFCHSCLLANEKSCKCKNEKRPIVNRSNRKLFTTL